MFASSLTRDKLESPVMVCGLSLCFFFKSLTKRIGRRMLLLFVFPLVHKPDDNGVRLLDICGLSAGIHELQQNLGHLQFNFQCDAGYFFLF